MKKDTYKSMIIPADEMADYYAVMNYMIAKLQLINSELSAELGRRAASNITGRVKSIESITQKLRHKHLEPTAENVETLTDIIGVRVACFFVDDLYRFHQRLKNHGDVSVIKVKDYIDRPKNSGYRSLHLICKLKMPHHDKNKEYIIEIQLRTTAMDYWAELDHRLRYKKESEKSERMCAKLKSYADEIVEIDKKMMKLRDEIEEL